MAPNGWEFQFGPLYGTIFRPKYWMLPYVFYRKKFTERFRPIKLNWDKDLWRTP